MTSVKGLIFKGYNGAADSIKDQKKYLVKYVPEIFGMYDGTINVLLEIPIHIAKYDAETGEKIEWRPNRWESFKIQRAAIQLCSSTAKDAVPCLLYFAGESPYRTNPFVLEVVAPKLPVEGVKHCFIILQQPCQQTSWPVAGYKVGV